MRISFEPTSAQQARDAAAMFSFLADRWGSRDAAEPSSKSIPGTFGTAKPLPDAFPVDPGHVSLSCVEMYNNGGVEADVFRLNVEALTAESPTGTALPNPTEALPTEPAPKRRRAPKAPAEPLVASAETAALASNRQPDISSSLGEDLSGLMDDDLPSGVTDVEVSHVTQTDDTGAAATPPSDDIDAELLAMMGEPKAEGVTSVSRYADWDEAKLRGEFVIRLKDKGAMWFREQMLNRNRTSINALTVEDLQVILAKADADNTAA